METFTRNDLEACKLLYNEMYSNVLNELDSLEQTLSRLCTVETKHERTVSKIKKIPLLGKLLAKKLES